MKYLLNFNNLCTRTYFVGCSLHGLFAKRVPILECDIFFKVNVLIDENYT